MSTRPPVEPPDPSPIFTLSVYQEGDQIKSIYCFRDPACDIQREMVLLLLRRALFALDHPQPTQSRSSPDRQRFSTP